MTGGPLESGSAAASDVVRDQPIASQSPDSLRTIAGVSSAKNAVLSMWTLVSSSLTRAPRSVNNAVEGKSFWRRIPSLCIPSARSVGWGLLFGILVFGPFAHHRYYHHPRVVSIRHKLKKMAKRSPLQLPLAGALVWVGLRVIHSLGFTLVVEVGALAAVVNYLVRQEQKRTSALQLELQHKLQSPDACFSVLGDKVPRWISFPNVQRAAWVNSIVAGLWPYVCEATQNVVKEKLAVALSQNKPVFLTSLELVNFTLGSAPINLEGVQHHTMENKDTVLDMHLSWRSEGFEVRFAAAMSPLAVVEASVTDVTFHFVTRIVLGPHLNTFPCLGAASVSILSAPDINFKLKAAKLSLDIIPGLSQWVDDFIRKILVAKMVYPRQLSFAIAQGFDLSTQESAFDHRAKALGRLKLTCHSALGLTTGLMEANSYHLEVGFVDANSTQKTAQHSEYSGVCNLNDQKFTMTVHDNTAVVGFWLYRDDLQRKKLIGQRTFTMSELMEGEKNNITLPLLHPKGRDCPAKIRLSTKFSAFAGDKHQQSGVFAPESEGTRGPDSPPRGPPQRSSSGTIHRPPLHRHASSSALTPRQGSAQGGASKSTTGLLFVRVENCKNLRNFEVVGTSDPYVVISIGDKTIKTQMVPNCLNPVFNYDAEVEIEDPTHAVAEIKVFDENVTKDILMGKTTIPLIDVIRSKGQLAKETRNLSPQGTITVTLTLRMES